MRTTCRSSHGGCLTRQPGRGKRIQSFSLEIDFPGTFLCQIRVQSAGAGTGTGVARSREPGARGCRSLPLAVFPAGTCSGALYWVDRRLPSACRPLSATQEHFRWPLTGPVTVIFPQPPHPLMRRAHTPSYLTPGLASLLSLRTTLARGAASSRPLHYPRAAAATGRVRFMVAVPAAPAVRRAWLSEHRRLSASGATCAASERAACTSPSRTRDTALL